MSEAIVMHHPYPVKINKKGEPHCALASPFRSESSARVTINLYSSGDHLCLISSSSMRTSAK